MKLGLILAVSLVAGSAFADDMVTVCNPQAPTQAFTVTITGRSLEAKNSVQGAVTDVTNSKIEKVTELNIQEMRDLATAGKLTVNLEQGTAYAIGEGAMAIAKDAKGGKYVFMASGFGIQLIGASNNCK
jgi:hypothetical protein